MFQGNFIFIRALYTFNFFPRFQVIKVSNIIFINEGYLCESCNSRTVFSILCYVGNSGRLHASASSTIKPVCISGF